MELTYNDVGRFIYFQTALCYGVKPLQQPIRLDHPKFPANSSYAITKTAIEDFLEISGLDYVTFRLANVVGPRNVSGPLPIFFQRLSEGKRCFATKARRDFVYVGVQQNRAGLVHRDVRTGVFGRVLGRERPDTLDEEHEAVEPAGPHARIGRPGHA